MDFCCTFISILIVTFVFSFLRWFIRADCDFLLHVSSFIGKNPKKSLQGKVIWITGASRGIGASLAQKLAGCGAKLVLMARTEEQLLLVKQKCIEAGMNSDDFLILAENITEKEKHEALLEKVLNKFGKLDILVSNAGRSQRAEWNKIELEVDRDLFDLNVFSLISLARVVNRHFKKSGSGSHVVMSSIAGIIGAPMSATYTASKHALHGYFESLRMEHGADNISVTLLCPGPVETTIIDECYTDTLGKPVEQQRVGKRMSAERCAELCTTAIANQLPQVWICEQPILLFLYVMQYCPILLFIVVRVIGLNTIMKLRDGRSDVVSSTEEKSE